MTGIDDLRLLQAIAAVEGNNWSIPGGGYQITKALWREFTLLPYAKSQDKQAATLVALRILAHFRKTTLTHKNHTTVYLLALRWRYGQGGMVERLKESQNGYASRVQNLYEDPSF